MSNTFQGYLEKQLRDPGVRAEYQVQELEVEKTKSTLHLMRELNQGWRSGEEDSGVFEKAVQAYFLNQSK